MIATEATMGSEWIKRVLVVGAGTMGHGIAMVFGLRGYEVDLMDISEEALNRALRVIRSNLETLKEERLVRSREIRTTLLRIHPTLSLDVGAKADFVVEAISEDPGAKRKLFHTLDQICAPRTIFASNTSYLNVFPYLKTKRVKKLVITHWWAPPHLIPLVDVVKGSATSPGTVKTVKELLIGLGKKPVVMRKFIPGYIVNRLQRAMAREIFYLLDGGYASPEEIDTAVKNSIGLRIPVVGVVQRYDFTGLDLALSFERNPSIHLVSKDRQPKTLMDLVGKGFLGVKSGKGFYDYSHRKAAEVMGERDKKLIALMKFLKSPSMSK
jgi:3-hydroxybutyryl-CoA dehydrogenase